MFRFKQFTILQDQCAIKVCTDACLFAAWVANFLLKKSKKPKTILDIGAGTGLLSLMLGQKVDANITALEIDVDTANQSKMNINNSSWADRITLVNIDANKFLHPEKFEHIISNPPFFSNNLQSDHIKKNLAKHDAGLSFKQLITVVERNLSDDGSFAVLLPYPRKQEIIGLANQFELMVWKVCDVRQTPDHDFFRTMLIFGRNDVEVEIQELTIKEVDGNYSLEFIKLLKDYYLYL